MQKVLYIIDTLQTGGAERSTLDIASRLTKFHPVVCQVYPKDDLSKMYTDKGIIFENLAITGKYEFRKAIAACRQLIRKHRPVLVIGTLMRAEIIARVAAKREGVPVLGTFVNDTYSKEALGAVPFSLRIKIRFFQLLNAYTARYCAAFLANAEAIKDSNAKALGISKDRIIVIHRGREVGKFVGSERRIADRSIRHFVNVGRLLERKGQWELIQAFSKHLEQFPESRLSIAGEGPFRSKLEALVNQLGIGHNVTLVGNISNVPSFLSEGDYFVFPSHYEGFSGALVEAALAGIPVIASDISMNREVLPDGSCLFFATKQADDLAGKMAQVTADPVAAAKRAAIAQEYAISHFDITHITRLHEATYAKYCLQKAQ